VAVQRESGGDYVRIVAGHDPGSLRHRIEEAERDEPDADLVLLDELFRQTPGAHPIGSIDELRCDAFDAEKELEEFLAFVTASRHADLA